MAFLKITWDMHAKKVSACGGRLYKQQKKKKAEKRADAFNTLSNSAAVIPAETLNEVVKQSRNVNSLFDVVRLFFVLSNLSVPVGTSNDAAAWHTEGAAVERQKAETTAVTFSGLELIKVLSMSAAVKRMTLSAFESYITYELKSCIASGRNKHNKQIFRLKGTFT